MWVNKKIAVINGDYYNTNFLENIIFCVVTLSNDIYSSTVLKDCFVLCMSSHKTDNL